MRILIVEDNNELAQTLSDTLQKNNYTTDVLYDGGSVISTVKKHPFDLIILDVDLPKKTGLCVCVELKSKGNTPPVLMLTKKSEIDDRVAGLNCGADDYLSKPFAMKELLARIRVLLRRTKGRKKQKIVINDVTLDISQRKFIKNGEVLTLSFREFGILEYLFLHKNQFVSLTEILEIVWVNKDGTVFTNTVDVHIRYLRRIFGDDFIKTARGFGYMVGKK